MEQFPHLQRERNPPGHQNHRCTERQHQKLHTRPAPRGVQNRSQIITVADDKTRDLTGPSPFRIFYFWFGLTKKGHPELFLALIPKGRSCRRPMPMPGIGGGEGRRPAREVAAVQQRGSGGIPYSSFREFEWMQIKSFLSQHHYCIKCLLGLPQQASIALSPRAHLAFAAHFTAVRLHHRNTRTGDYRSTSTNHRMDS